MFVAVFRILGVLLICCLGTACHQSPATANSGVAPATTADTLRDGHLVGTVVDSETSDPLASTYVIVTVHGIEPGKQHAVVSVTDSTGRYAFRLPYGQYDLHYSRLGYNNLRRLGVRLSKTKADSIVVRLRDQHLQLNPTVAPGGPTKLPSPKR
jgi:hypothetical protein